MSRDGLPYNPHMGMSMLQMRESLCNFSNALETSTSRQAQAEIYLKRAHLYFQFVCFLFLFLDSFSLYLSFHSFMQIRVDFLNFFLHVTFTNTLSFMHINFFR